jgi:hypothetical protein
VISGPNAGLDAVKTAIDCGFRIVWVTGRGRPGFLPGTDNERVEQEYDECVAGRPSAIGQVIKSYAYLATPNPSEDEGRSRSSSTPDPTTVRRRCRRTTTCGRWVRASPR